MDWADIKQVLQLWVKLREGLVSFCKQKPRTREEVGVQAERLVVESEAPLDWVDRLVFTVSKLINIEPKS